MNLNVNKWKKWFLNQVFDISYGNKFDNNKMTHDEPCVNFVSRTANNNGVSDVVDIVDGCEPYEGGLITVALGGSLGSSFIQSDRFYTGQNVAVLTPKKAMSDEVKLFITTIIMYECRYKFFAFGRELNSHIKKDFSLYLPVTELGELDFAFMEECIKNLKSKKITTKIKPSCRDYSSIVFKEFSITKYFKVVPGIYHYPDEYDEGHTPYLSATNEDNGIKEYISLEPEFKGNCIVTGKIGCTAFYQKEDFCATSDCNIFIPLFNMNKYHGLFITSILNYSENYKWNYGRQCRVQNSKKIKIKLPCDSSGEPDWDLMESIVKSYPYGDRI